MYLPHGYGRNLQVERLWPVDVERVQRARALVEGKWNGRHPAGSYDGSIAATAGQIARHIPIAGHTRNVLAMRELSSSEVGTALGHRVVHAGCVIGKDRPGHLQANKGQIATIG